MKDGRLEVGDRLYYIENGYRIYKYGEVIRVTKTQAIVKLFTDNRGNNYTRKVYIGMTDDHTYEIGLSVWNRIYYSLMTFEVDEKLKDQEKRDTLVFTIQDKIQKSRSIPTDKLVRIVDILKEGV